jgi:metal-dependent amidase/aminoacylase/carboxypeptidase family protein
MVHPAPDVLLHDGATGVAYAKSLANIKFRIHFTGKPAHAALAPWQGVNALDAVCLAYNGVAMLRQQTKPHERIHGVIVEGGKRPNVITAQTTMEYYCRSSTLAEAEILKDRVVKCSEGAATSTGCTFKYEAYVKLASFQGTSKKFLN